MKTFLVSLSLPVAALLIFGLVYFLLKPALPEDTPPEPDQTTLDDRLLVLEDFGRVANRQLSDRIDTLQEAVDTTTDSEISRAEFDALHDSFVLFRSDFDALSPDRRAIAEAFFWFTRLAWIDDQDEGDEAIRRLGFEVININDGELNRVWRQVMDGDLEPGWVWSRLWAVWWEAIREN